MKLKIITMYFLILGLSGLGIFFGSTPLSNVYSLQTDTGYFIPSESNIMTFKMLKKNLGSGDWWIYGEDNVNYYALTDEPPWGYYVLNKHEVPDGFKVLEKETWGLKKKFSQIP